MIDAKTKNTIEGMLVRCQFKALCDTYFDVKFNWVIKGTSVLSGTYEDKELFFDKVIGRLNDVVQNNWKMHLLGTYIDNDVMIIEMKGEVKAKSGADYNNDYCWIFRFQEGKVVNLTAYYDSLLVDKTLAENERLFVYVKHYLKPEGIQYIDHTWFPKVKAIMQKIPGYIGFTHDTKLDKKDCVNFTVAFQSKAALDAWIVHPEHRVVDDLDSYRSRAYWEAVQSRDGVIDRETLSWVAIPSVNAGA